MWACTEAIPSIPTSILEFFSEQVLGFDAAGDLLT
jgi:hypothetical protein